MKIRLKLLLWTKDADKQGHSPIAIRITGGGQVTYYNTGTKVPKDNWKEGKIVEVPNADIKNAKLKQLITDAERDILNMELQGLPIDVHVVKAMFYDGPVRSRSFYTFAETLIAGKNASTKRRYTVEVEKIKIYAGKTLSFAEITPKWLTAYHKYLLSPKGDKSGNNPNTAINAFKVIRHAFLQAIEEKAIDKSLNPFTDWKYPQYKAPKRTYLTLEECNKIFGLLDNKYDWDVRLISAFFLLECFSGIRVSDWGKFSIEKVVKNNDMIFTTTKTGTEVRLPIDLMPSLAKVLQYIADNKLKFTYTGEFANRTLKNIKGLAGLTKNLTTHVARHTFATHSLSIGLTKEFIAEAMGITSKQVETYAKVSPDKFRNELSRIGGGV